MSPFSRTELCLCLIIICAVGSIYGQSMCASGMSMCRSVRKCVSDHKRCDGVNDCGDWSDEDTCPTFSCAENQFHCLDGPCIDASWKCDFYPDCDDGSDEMGCTR